MSGTTLLPIINTAQCRAIEDQVLKTWERRRNQLRLNKKHLKTKKLQCEFLMGMVAVTDILSRADETNNSSISPKVLFGILRGDYIE